MPVAVKRVYEPRDEGDGHRVLVDRLWPRGLTAADAGVDEWARSVAPSTALRKWYGHDPAKYDDFRGRYLDELADVGDDLAHLRRMVATGQVTLLTATKDVAISHAAVLAATLAQPDGP